MLRRFNALPVVVRWVIVVAVAAATYAVVTGSSFMGGVVFVVATATLVSIFGALFDVDQDTGRISWRRRGRRPPT